MSSGVVNGPHPAISRAVTWVGLDGLEPSTSSLSGMADPQASRDAGYLTSTFTAQHPPAHPTGTRASDARMTHGERVAAQEQLLIRRPGRLAVDRQ